MRLLLTLFVSAVLTTSAAHGDKRVAFGNKDYKASVGPLTNPLNDIRLLSGALRSVVFEQLEPVENGTREEILRRIYEFASILKNAGPDAAGLLYYSGHGVTPAAENYLIPVDITEPSTEQLRIQGVKQSELLAILRDESPNAAHYLVLDACRDNLREVRGGKGFVPVGQQNGVLVAFSTEPGKTALDTAPPVAPAARAGSSSPYDGYTVPVSLSARARNRRPDFQFRLPRRPDAHAMSAPLGRLFPCSPR